MLKEWLHEQQRWFNGYWYSYLFKRPFNFVKLICRLRLHPCNVIWYSGGLVPNMHCKNCGDDLG